MTDKNLWHKCWPPLIPRRTVNGKWTFDGGQTWRRRRLDGGWQYLQDEESAEDWLDWQV